MRISDWSSDVCSSDLRRLHDIMMLGRCVHGFGKFLAQHHVSRCICLGQHVYGGGAIVDEASPQCIGISESGPCYFPGPPMILVGLPRPNLSDRKRDVRGTRGAVRVDLGGGRLSKKKKTNGK